MVGVAVAAFGHEQCVKHLVTHDAWPVEVVNHGNAAVGHPAASPTVMAPWACSREDHNVAQQGVGVCLRVVQDTARFLLDVFPRRTASP